MEEAKRKVHIVLSKRAVQSEGGTENLLKAIADVANLDAEACAKIRARYGARLARFGMLSAEIPASSIDRLREIPGVEAVELDTIKHAI